MKERLRLEAQLFLISLAYLTWIPVPWALPDSDDLVVRARKYQPLVGALVGLIAAVCLWTAQVVLPWLVAVLLAVCVAMLVTGAFHEDGLADAADGLGAGKDRNQTLRIMNDARLGTYGGLTLGLTVALKVALLVSMPPLVAGLALVAGHAVARMAVVHVMVTNVPAHLVGLRAKMPSVTSDGYRVALGVSLAALIPLVVAEGVGAAICLFLGAVVMGQAFRMLFIRRIGGYTGDCLGGVQQMAELGAYLGLAICL